MSDKQDSKEKPQLTKEQVAMLMQRIANQQMSAQNQNITKGRMIVQKAMVAIVQKMQNFIATLDRFINFVTKKQDANRNAVLDSARSPILFGLYVIIICVVIGGLWASLAPLNSAAVASGVVIPSSNKKVIQAPPIGSNVIKEIFVKQGQEVKAGDKLIEFEETNIKAEYENALNTYRNLLASEDRLVAERDNLEDIEYDPFLLKDQDDPRVAKLLNTQRNLLLSKRSMIKAQKDSYRQKIAQSNKQIEGLEARKISYNKSLNAISSELSSKKKLFEKGFIDRNSILKIEAQQSDVISNLSVVDTEIAKVQQEITVSEITIMNIDHDNITKVLSELKDVQTQVSISREKFLNLKDALSKIVLKSPVDGVVNAIYVHTIGGVAQAGLELLEITPVNDQLIIEAKVPQKNIDAVRVGLKAKIRFSAFKSRTTPTFSGTVISLSPDIVSRDQRGQPVQVQGANPMQSDTAYIARIEIDMDEFEKIAKKKNLELHPGMNAEVQIVTGTRTLLRYLLDPLLDSISKAFKEK